MTNMAGSMNNTIGIVSLAPSLCALSSSLMILSPEFVSDSAQSLAQRRSVLQALADHGAELGVVPPTSIPDFSNASRRFGNIRRSSRRPYKTWAMAGFDRFISSATRSSALSRPIPASLHTTSKSMASGVPRRMAALKRRLSTERSIVAP